ncbi:hypothetical protein JVU11DRAFT_7719 [Chiua virens]|nr:hypothetical protein JVU11DRAFT_7719 [Chiua virens]
MAALPNVCDVAITQEEQFDAIIVGAGFSGMHHLHLLRQRGLRCTVIDAGGDFGGTWWWNTYPGVRVDSYIPLYELSIPELWKGWTWREKFPAGKELQAYFMYAGEKLDLRPYCRFNTVVKQARWDDQLHCWHVIAEGKDGIYKAVSRYLILCTGFASKPYIPNVSGLENFKGPWCHTSRWPREGIETTGKRVAVIGTGASGVQVIQELGPHVTHLTVFQRTPNMALPMDQYRVHKEFQDHFKPVYSELYKKLDTTFAGYPAEPRLQPLSSDSAEEREAYYERIWSLGGFNFSLNNYQDILLNMESNAAAYAFWRKKVGERVKDPRKRKLLAPAVPPHPIGVKRQSLELNFYEVFNQDNVDLIDLKATPILEINEHGLKTAEKEYEFDVLIFATGFDSYVGGFNDIDLRGANDEGIQDHWKDGVTT